MGRIFFLLSFVAFGVVILISAQPPIFRDYPDWVFQGALLARTLTGHPVAGYALKMYPVPNSLTTVGLGLLTIPFGWLLAAKLWLIVYLVLGAVTSLYVARVFGVKDAALWWVLPGTLFLGQMFWFGTISFNIGLCVLLLFGAQLYQQKERASIILTLLLLCFFTHLIVYAAAILMLIVYCLQYRRWQPLSMGLLTVPLVLWYGIGRVLSHSNESEHGYTPTSHIAVPCLVALAVLVVSYLRPRWSIHRRLFPVVALLYGLEALAAIIVTLAITAPSPTSRAHGLQSLLQVKMMSPYTAFGFVNIVYKPIHDRLLSSTLTLLHEPAFVVLMAASIVVGIVLIADMALPFLRNTDEEAGPQPDDFLWNFVVILGLLYLVCPPNGLGVIGIDMRLGEMAFAPAIFLLAQRKSTTLRYVSVPCAILMVVNLYQLSVSQKQVIIPGTEVHLPGLFAEFSAVDPIVLSKEYDWIRRDDLNSTIFATGIFVETGHHESPIFE